VTRLDIAVDRDLEYLDLICLFPGASIGDLSRLAGDSYAVAQSHVWVLTQARLVVIYSARAGGGYMVRVVYPFEMKK
jgi:hypothetical protein